MFATVCETRTRYLCILLHAQRAYVLLEVAQMMARKFYQSEKENFLNSIMLFNVHSRHIQNDVNSVRACAVSVTGGE